MRRHFTTLVFVLVVLPAAAVVAVVSVWAYSSWKKPAAVSPEDFGPVANFSLIERSGRTVRAADFQGKVWVASFVFTRCSGACPQITGTLARLQDDLKTQPDVVLVSISVDPQHDTPEVLKAYADRFGADPERWLFLTGDQDEIYRLSEKGFHLGVAQTQGAERRPGNEVMHSWRLALVDRKGHVRGYFDGRQTDEDGRPIDELPKLRQAIADLVREQP